SAATVQPTRLNWSLLWTHNHAMELDQRSFAGPSGPDASSVFPGGPVAGVFTATGSVEAEPETITVNFDLFWRDPTDRDAREKAPFEGLTTADLGELPMVLEGAR
ncbi:MAG: hypothetical protein AAF658_13525, partial [Myxococcota bacterium]